MALILLLFSLNENIHFHSDLNKRKIHVFKILPRLTFFCCIENGKKLTLFSFFKIKKKKNFYSVDIENEYPLPH